MPMQKWPSNAGRNATKTRTCPKARYLYLTLSDDCCLVQASLFCASDYSGFSIFPPNDHIYGCPVWLCCGYVGTEIHEVAALLGLYLEATIGSPGCRSFGQSLLACSRQAMAETLTPNPKPPSRFKGLGFRGLGFRVSWGT